MNAIVSAIVVTSVVLLISALLMRSRRSNHFAALHEVVPQRLDGEDCRRADEPPFASTDGNSWLIQQQDPELKPNDNVTRSLTNPADRSCCPACGAIITANDERCPSCDISFIADGSQKWTLGNLGPADGICLPPTDVCD